MHNSNKMKRNKKTASIILFTEKATNSYSYNKILGFPAISRTTQQILKFFFSVSFLEIKIDNCTKMKTLSLIFLFKQVWFLRILFI